MPRQADDQKLIEWRARLAQHANSGLTEAGFCEREDVATALLCYWQRKCQSEAGTQEQPRAEFAPVEDVRGSSVTIRFPGGAVMQIPEPRKDLLRALVAALAEGRKWIHPSKYGQGRSVALQPFLDQVGLLAAVTPRDGRPRVNTRAARDLIRDAGACS